LSITLQPETVIEAAKKRAATLLFLKVIVLKLV
jgi:hypothetical protein